MQAHVHLLCELRAIVKAEWFSRKSRQDAILSSEQASHPNPNRNSNRSPNPNPHPNPNPSPSPNPNPSPSPNPNPSPLLSSEQSFTECMRTVQRKFDLSPGDFPAGADQP